jgi:hypothetical protein
MINCPGDKRHYNNNMITDKEVIKIVKQLGMIPLLYKMTKIAYGFKHQSFYFTVQKNGGVHKWLLSSLKESEDGLIETLDRWDKFFTKK